MAAEDETTDDDGDELTPEEKAEKLHEGFVESADEALNRWHETAPQETRELVIAKYVMDGTIDPAVAGVDPLEVQVIEAAFTGHVERNVLKGSGLTMTQWQEHMDETDLPAFRKAIIEGDWGALRNHVAAATKLRRELGI